MNNNIYKKIVDKHKKKNKYLKNYISAFLSGGLIGMTSQLIFIILKNITKISPNNIKGCISLFIIGIASFLTAIGIFDNMIKKCRSGLIIPTTGFAHSVTSSTLDYKKEGLINGLGSNSFRLAGSVIIYSVVVSFLLVLLKVIISA